MAANNRKKIIHTNDAPSAIGAYSQAVQVGNLVFISGQIAINPQTNLLENDTIESEITQVFKNIAAICTAAGANINNIVKINVYLTDLKNFNIVNNIIATVFDEPYPARAAVEVSRLPKDVNFEAEAILEI